MRVITLKLPPDLDAMLDRIAQQRGKSRSAIIREALAAYVARPAALSGSVLEAAGSLIGSLRGGPRDLSTNPKHLDGFGG